MSAQGICLSPAEWLADTAPHSMGHWQNRQAQKFKTFVPTPPACLAFFIPLSAHLAGAGKITHVDTWNKLLRNSHSAHCGQKYWLFWRGNFFFFAVSGRKEWRGSSILHCKGCVCPHLRLGYSITTLSSWLWPQFCVWFHSGRKTHISPQNWFEETGLVFLSPEVELSDATLKWEIWFYQIAFQAYPSHLFYSSRTCVNYNKGIIWWFKKIIMVML